MNCDPALAGSTQFERLFVRECTNPAQTLIPRNTALGQLLSVRPSEFHNEFVASLNTQRHMWHVQIDIKLYGRQNLPSL